jgi:hypothetical protein
LVTKATSIRETRLRPKSKSNSAGPLRLLGNVAPGRRS